MDDEVQRANAGRLVGGGGERDGLAVDQAMVGDLHGIIHLKPGGCARGQPRRGYR